MNAEVSATVKVPATTGTIAAQNHSRSERAILSNAIAQRSVGVNQRRSIAWFPLTLTTAHPAHRSNGSRQQQGAHIVPVQQTLAPLLGNPRTSELSAAFSTLSDCDGQTCRFPGSPRGCTNPSRRIWIVADPGRLRFKTASLRHPASCQRELQLRAGRKLMVAEPPTSIGGRTALAVLFKVEVDLSTGGRLFSVGWNVKEPDSPGRLRAFSAEHLNSLKLSREWCRIGSPSNADALRPHLMPRQHRVIAGKNVTTDGPLKTPAASSRESETPQTIGRSDNLHQTHQPPSATVRRPTVVGVDLRQAGWQP